MGSSPQPQNGRGVWLVGLYFGVGASPTGVLLESLAVALAARGYSVEAVAGRVSYGEGVGSTPERFRGRVHRLFSGPGQATGFLGRFLTWAGFYAAVVLFAFTRRLPAVVILTTTPPLLHAAFVVRRLVTRSRFQIVLWNQDTYPDILAAVGVLHPGGMAYRVLSRVERWAVRRVERVVVLDAAMAGILAGHGAAAVRVIPNWETRRERPPGGPPDYLDEVLAASRRRYRYVLLYSGNYGWGHDLRPLLAWLRINPDQRDFFPVFVGGGEKWGELVAEAADLGPGRVAVVGYLPGRRYARLLTQVDFGLVTLQDGCAGLMAPSKIHTYLAAGRPLVYLGPSGSNVGEVIEQYGCGVRAGYEAGALAAALVRLAGPGCDYGRMTDGAVAAAERHTEEAGTAAFDRLLGELLTTGSPSNQVFPPRGD